MTTSNINPEMLQDSRVEGSDGQNIGKVGQVYVDNQTGQPSWVAVKTGWFGTSESLVPLDTASIDGDIVRVPYDKDMIKDAPHYEVDVPLSETDEQELYAYYGLDFRSYVDTVGTNGVTAERSPSIGHTEHGGEYLTRSEEQLHVGTETVQTGRARLRKFVVTEEQTVTVPVSHEEVRLVREPLEPGEAVGDATIEEAASDVTLTEERLIVSKETVPVEKVGLATETVTEQQDVTESVRKEQIEFDDGSGTSYADKRLADDKVPPTR